MHLIRYEGQPETADEPIDDAASSATTAGLVVTPAGVAEADAASSAVTAEAASHAVDRTAPGAAAAAPSGPASHVPTVLTKLQKWGDYHSYGEPVWPTRFIPMKTPLSAEILDHWQLPEAPKHRLTVEALLQAQAAAGRRVGLLLDLSNHGG